MTEIEKVPIFSPKTILLFRVYRVKKIRVGKQQERTYISFKPNATLCINAPIFGEQCFGVDV